MKNTKGQVSMTAYVCYTVGRVLPPSRRAYCTGQPYPQPSPAPTSVCCSPSNMLVQVYTRLGKKNTFLKTQPSVFFGFLKLLFYNLNFRHKLFFFNNTIV